MNPRAQLRKWRGKRSQRLVAELLGCHFTNLSHIERGRSKPALALANKIQDVVGIPSAAWISVSSRKAS